MGLDKDTQDFKGFAHIELVSDGDLARALKKNGKELLGREMKVAYATERRKNPTASFGKGGGEGGQMKKRGKKSSGNIERK
jgi:nucleolin